MRAINIFRSGCHISSAGDRLCFGNADIDSIAERYDPSVHRAPLVLGHPKIDGPAYGWVSELQAFDGDLYAFTENVSEDLKSHVKARRYRNVSASFYAPDNSSNPRPGDWYLRHVGFLGATPPAVRGLEEPAFGEACSMVDIDTACCANDFVAPNGYSVDPNGSILHRRAMETMQRHPSMNYLEAVGFADMSERIRAEWQASPELQAEFGEAETYVAFRRAEALKLVQLR